MLQLLFPKVSKRPANIHRAVVEIAKEVLRFRRILGATTGFLMRWIERHYPDVAAQIALRVPPGGGEAERVQQFKIAISQALAELEDSGFAHCDSIGKQKMVGDSNHVAVWRTMEDWQDLASAFTWVNSKSPYARRQRLRFQGLNSNNMKQ